MTTSAATPKPWYTRWWVWVAAAVAVLVVISVIGNALTPGGQQDSGGAPTASRTSTSSPVSTPTAEASTPPAATTPAADLNATAFSALQEQFGGAEPADVFASYPSLWYGWVSGTRVDGSNFIITLQVGPGDDGRRDLGERAANAIPTLLPADVKDDLSWVIVEDAAGTVIDQKML